MSDFFWFVEDVLKIKVETWTKESLKQRLDPRQLSCIKFENVTQFCLDYKFSFTQMLSKEEKAEIKKPPLPGAQIFNKGDEKEARKKAIEIINS